MTQMAPRFRTEVPPPVPSGLLAGAVPLAGRKHGPGAWKQDGIVLDGYKMDGLLGEGTCGQVYKLSVKAPELREYAVKHLLLANRDDRRGFLRELQTWIDLPEHEPLDEGQLAAWIVQATALPGWLA